MRKSVWPFCSKHGIYEDDDRIDLYGPIWIMITLVVEVAIVGYINYHIAQAALQLELQNGHHVNGTIVGTRSFAAYSLEKVARSSFVIFFYFTLNPLMEMLIIRYTLNIEEVQYLWLFGTYGYSYTCYIATTGLVIVPLEWLRWVLLSTSAVVSFCVIVAELWRRIGDKVRGALLGKFAMLCCYLVVSHGVFVLAMKKYFLNA